MFNEFTDELAYNTVRIFSETETGEFSTGTGFFFMFERNENEVLPLLITNKHVITNAKKGKISLTLMDNSGNPDLKNIEHLEIDNFEKLWIDHPDENIDLCCLPFGPIIEHLRKKNKDVFFKCINKKMLPSEEDIKFISNAENIIMVGYPNGLWDEVNNAPIFRTGTLASDFRLNWNGKDEFLIDAACFPGSSGSPIYLYNKGSYRIGSTTHMKDRIKFLGILYAGPQYTVQGQIKITPIATQQTLTAVTNIPNNLGFVIKSNKILDFEERLKS